MMEKLQRFGAAMFVPVLLFSFAGIVVAITSLFNNPMVFGSLADPNSLWYGIWDTIQQGGWTVFNQVALLFVVGLPIGLAKNSQGRAAMESLVTYFTYNYFISSILNHWGPFFGVNNFQDEIVANATNGGLTMIAGVKTLDTSIIGALVVAGVVVWLHNHYFDKKLPEFLGTFQGSTYVVMLGFFVMLPLALLTCLVWPKVQAGILVSQHFIANSGVIGVWIFNFLNRILIPTGLHHLVYIPFQYGPAAVDGGLQPFWLQNLAKFAQSTQSLKSLAPEAYMLYGNEKIFLVPAICLAFYHTAKESKKKESSALLIPAALTSFFAGITEPVDFTYLFAAPVLWVIYSVISATMNTIMYALGVVGVITDGAIGVASMNWLPLWANHWPTYLIQIAVGLVSAVIIFFVFSWMIEKYDYLTPGREAEDEAVKLINKKQYKEAMAAKESGKSNKKGPASDPYTDRANAYEELLGGADNIQTIVACATRLRVTVDDPDKVGSDNEFRNNEAVGVVRHGKAVQVIVGLDVTQVLEKMEDSITKQKGGVKVEMIDDPLLGKATTYVDLLGGESNIVSIDNIDNEIVVKVKDIDKVSDQKVIEKYADSVVINSENMEVHISESDSIDTIIDHMRNLEER